MSRKKKNKTVHGVETHRLSGKENVLGEWLLKVKLIVFKDMNGLINVL